MPKGTDKEREAVMFYISRGWTPEQAIGIVGNLKRESGLQTTISGDNGVATGIAQWHPDRYNRLKQQYGDKSNDFYNQLAFVDWELNNTEKKAGDLLRNSKGVWEAGRIISDEYERPKVKFGNDKTRQSHVSNIASKFKGITLTDEDRKRFQNSLSSQSYGSNPQINVNFEGVPDVYREAQKEEVAQAKEELSQKEKEYNFIQELRSRQEQQLALQQQQEDYSNQEEQSQDLQQETPLEIFNNISQFVDAPIAQQGGEIIKDNNGYWNPDNHGKVVEIGSNMITMKGVKEPLLGVSKETGERKIMYPDLDYFFKNTKNVIEIPIT